MADDAVVEQRPHGVELLVAGNLGVDPVQLPEPDRLHPEPLATLQRLFAQIIRAAVRLPGAGPASPEPRLGGDENAFIGVQNFANEVLGDIRAVGVCGINEIDAEFGNTPKCPHGFFPVFRRTPYARPGQAHGAKAEAMDFDIPADLE